MNEYIDTPGYEGMMGLLSNYESPYPQSVRNTLYDRLEKEKESYTLEELQSLYQVSDEAMRAVCEDESREDGLFYCNITFSLEAWIKVADKKEKQGMILSDHELASESLTAIDASALLRELVGNCCGILGSPRLTSHEEGIIRRVLKMLPTEELHVLRDMSVARTLSSKAGKSSIIVPRNYERAIVVLCDELLEA